MAILILSLFISNFLCLKFVMTNPPRTHYNRSAVKKETQFPLHSPPFPINFSFDSPFNVVNPFFSFFFFLLSALSFILFRFHIFKRFNDYKQENLPPLVFIVYSTFTPSFSLRTLLSHFYFSLSLVTIYCFLLYITSLSLSPSLFCLNSLHLISFFLPFFFSLIDSFPSTLSICHLSFYSLFLCLLF